MIDLFAGGGIFSFAAKTVGWETLIFCEIDEFTRRLLRKNYPSVPIAKNIKNLTYEKIKEAAPQIKEEEPIITVGGFPCQPFSTAGLRGGSADYRFLWPEMFRIALDSGSSWILGENVNGILTMDDGAVFEAICRQMEIEGYEVQPFIIPASGTGAPHGRDRVWIVGHSKDRREAAINRVRQGSNSHAYGVNPDAQRPRGDDQKQKASFRARTSNDANGDNDNKDSRGKAETPRIQREHWKDYFSTGEPCRTTKDGRHIWEYSPNYLRENWLEALSRIHRIYDGVARGVHPITTGGISPIASTYQEETSTAQKHRIRVLGNSVAPYVVIPIFRAIQAYEDHYYYY